jgi:predicted NUDIX family phosphoesterase
MAQVLVVDRDAWFHGDWPQGFHAIAAAERDTFLQRAWRTARFVERPVAEATPAWKQWIPYCVLVCGDGSDDGAGVFVVRRTRGQSETRLHGQWSIGLGGHVEPEDAQSLPPDADGARRFGAALLRELTEELEPRGLTFGTPEFLGLLNDDSTDVGRVHAGLVYRLVVPLPLAEARARLGIREISKMTGGFTHLVGFFKLWQNPPQFETWSQVLICAGLVGPTDDCHTDQASDRPR